jgi:hypothetical protein
MKDYVCNLEYKQIAVDGIVYTLTKETLDKTCSSYADNLLKQLAQAEDGTQPVNNLESFREYVKEQCQVYKQGLFVAGLWFWQRAYFIQTGRSVSVL